MDNAINHVLKIGNVSITWLGHATFLIRAYHNNGTVTVIIVDPFKKPSAGILADVVLSTHAHYDHSSGIDEVSKPDAVVFGPAGVKEKTARKFVELRPDQEGDAKWVKVRAIHSYNVNKPFHPKGSCIGFIATIDGVRIYAAGDTDLIPEMEALANQKIDVALLPVCGSVTMDQDEAVSAALMIRPKIVVPMHYGSVSGLDADAGRFKKDLDAASGGSIKTVVLQESESP